MQDRFCYAYERHRLVLLVASEGKLWGTVECHFETLKGEQLDLWH